MSYPKSLNDWVYEAYKNSADHGFWSEKPVEEYVAQKLLLITCEIAEAYEEWRAKDVIRYEIDLNGKPVGFDSEIIDAIIRLFDLSGAMGIDVEQVMRDKMEYNSKREYMHGKKA